MRYNPLRWLWGLIPIVLLSWVASLGEADGIQKDLGARATDALKRAGATWAKPSFEGRDATLAGIAADETDPGRASEIVRRVWGVRIVDNKASLLDKVDKYVWSTLMRNGTISIRGHAPNDAARREIIGLIRANLPDHKLDDRMKLVRGAPPEGPWLGGISFGLKQLSQLKSGELTMERLALTLEGEARDSAAYSRIRSAMRGGLPKGVQLAADKVRAPLVKPFVWSVARAANQLTFSGHVPSEAARDALLAEVGKIDRKLGVNFRGLEIAEGAPDGWSAAVFALVRQMAKLESGEASLSDRRMTVKGLTDLEETASAIREVLDRGLPAGYRATHTISFRKPKIPVVSPYVTTIDLGDGLLVTVNGHVPNAGARAGLVANLRARLPKARLVDRTEVGSGAPDGWLACIEAGVGALARLGRGTAKSIDRRLEISGSTEDGGLAASLEAELKRNAGRSCEARSKVTSSLPPEPRLVWRAERSEQRLVLAGEVPDGDSRDSILATARRDFSNYQVEDRMQVVGVKPAGWVGVALEGMRALAQMRSGIAVIEGRDLRVAGQVADATVLTAIRERLRREVPKNYRALDVLEVRSDAMIWAETEARRKREEAEARSRAEAEARARAEAEARRRAGQEARRRAEEQERMQAELEARRRAEEARRDAERQARERDEAAARGRAEEAARAKTLADRVRAEAAARAKAEAEVRASRPVVTPERVAKATECGKRIRVVAAAGAIRFQRASAELDDASATTLDQVASVAKACPGFRIEIEGHTDSEGLPSRNQILSQRRASAVVEQLVSRGIDQSRISAVGHGAERPVANNETIEGRALNRRIEFVVKPD